MREVAGKGGLIGTIGLIGSGNWGNYYIWQMFYQVHEAYMVTIKYKQR